MWGRGAARGGTLPFPAAPPGLAACATPRQHALGPSLPLRQHLSDGSQHPKIRGSPKIGVPPGSAQHTGSGDGASAPGTCAVPQAPREGNWGARLPLSPPTLPATTCPPPPAALCKNREMVGVGACVKAAWLGAALFSSSPLAKPSRHCTTPQPSSPGGLQAQGLAHPTKKPFSTLPCVPINPAMGRRDPWVFLQFRGDPKSPGALAPSRGTDSPRTAAQSAEATSQPSTPILAPVAPARRDLLPVLRPSLGPPLGREGAGIMWCPMGRMGSAGSIRGSPTGSAPGCSGRAGGSSPRRKRGTCASSSSTGKPPPTLFPPRPLGAPQTQGSILPRL